MLKTIRTAQYRTTGTGNGHELPAPPRPALEDPTKLEDGAVRIVAWRSPKHVVIGLVKIGMAKGHMRWYQSFAMGAFGGLCIVFGAVLAILCAAGLHADATLNPPQPTVGWVGADRLVLGLTFPVALVLITMSGAELFTGNTMYATVALLARKVTLRDAACNLWWSYAGNLAGCLFGAYFFAYLTDVATAEPYAAYTRYIATAKTHLPWGVALLRGIPCNILVCLAIISGLAADTALGKLVGLWLPITVFAVCGFEHCVANMVFVPLGMLNHASVGVGRFVGSNLVPVTIGNGIGATVFVGAFFYAVYQPHMTKQIAALKLKYATAPVAASSSASAPTTDAVTTTASGGAGDARAGDHKLQPAHSVVMDMDMVAAPTSASAMALAPTIIYTDRSDTAVHASTASAQVAHR